MSSRDDRQSRPAYEVLWVAGDHKLARDVHSRYEGYLNRRAGAFYDDGRLVVEAGHFAGEALTTACPPVMSPGYVRLHPRVREVRWCWEDPDWPAVQLDLVAPHPARVRGPLAGWHGWDHCGWGEQQHWYEPLGLPAAFTTLTLRVLVEVSALPEPRYQAGAPDADTAAAAVRVVCGQVNRRAGAVLAALEGVAR